MKIFFRFFFLFLITLNISLPSNVMAFDTMVQNKTLNLVDFTEEETKEESEQEFTQELFFFQYTLAFTIPDEKFVLIHAPITYIPSYIPNFDIPPLA